MVFSNPEFLFAFIPITLLLYYLFPFRLRNIVLLAVSLVFYGWGEPAYLFLMMATIAADYVFGYLVDKFRDNRRRARTVLVVAVIFNLLILGFFKYYDFLIENLRLIPGLSFLEPLNLGLPIGISFYTFQALSYVIDVYRMDANVQKNIASFGAYVTLYPQLIAGPIVRYRDVDEQLRYREHSVSKFASGVRRFTVGLAKKIILANVVYEIWQKYQNMPADSLTVLGAWMGIIAFTFQIYFDFSGYSDMAIGLGRMIGFEFIENFNYPYISRSITDFWRRWHISLSTWFKEYVYIPLGGNRVGRFKMYRNIFVVWFLTGFWHGASWNYIIWGLYYCVLLILEKTFLLRVLDRLPKFVAHLYSLFFIVIGWLLFAFEDIGAGMVYLGHMFGGGGAGMVSAGDLYDLVRNLLFMVILIIGSTPLPKRIYQKLTEKSRAMQTVFSVGCLLLIVVSIAYMVSSSFNPFLYLRF